MAKEKMSKYVKTTTNIYIVTAETKKFFQVLGKRGNQPWILYKTDRKFVQAADNVAELIDIFDYIDIGPIRDVHHFFKSVEEAKAQEDDFLYDYVNGLLSHDGSLLLVARSWDGGKTFRVLDQNGRPQSEDPKDW